MTDHSNELPPSFELPLRVYWEDTDAGGIVYHANYLRFMDRARSDWLRLKGIGQRQARDHLGGMFVVTGLSMRYLLPARLDDALLVTAALQHMGRASMTILQKVLRVHETERSLLCEAQVRIGWVNDQSMRPARIPDHVQTLFQ